MADGAPMGDGVLAGKHVLAGLTFVKPDGAVVQRLQVHGTIIRVDAEVVTVKLIPSGDEFAMPAHGAAYQRAAPGRYQLQASGEVVENPDILCAWTITLDADGSLSVPAAPPQD